ncbi:hypothetical protein BAUCODRAFT_122834 [Baudoinia panamericana UAMH 10762]|uniref:DASH complex subunit SPC34 n=1 Tax=Baudoinia panamericana (strain UAMH 10762) TaxID=717646 RepID=M2MVC2_BAUPA|nr:uncharacterized protein BAUCODRAFT_122834 [Baudoinia panamericana UAMH 10762]EMC95518.1 hypothetical protein BAUCODRAFT_122834 [Baudoinia panamericana UAMH 10762]
MTSLLSSHLEQISLCSQSIADLSFPGPKAFTNALLSPHHDITALIRDTEPHERALFQLAPPALPTRAADFTSSVISGASTRRATAHLARHQPRSRAVAAVLGGELYQKTRRVGAEGDATLQQKGELDVELLLEGAAKLAAVYPIAGATERISVLRQRHQQLAASIAHYQDRVTRNAQELQLMTRPGSRGGYAAEGDAGDQDVEGEFATEKVDIATKLDLEREEEEVRELERKKKALEDRVTGMERDLGGLIR